MKFHSEEILDYSAALLGLLEDHPIQQVTIFIMMIMVR